MSVGRSEDGRRASSGGGQQPGVVGDVVAQPQGYTSWAQFDVGSWAADWFTNPASNQGLRFDMGGQPGYCVVLAGATQQSFTWTTDPSMLSTYLEITYTPPGAVTTTTVPGGSGIPVR